MAKTAKAITTIQNGSSSCRTRASHAALPPAWRTRAPSAEPLEPTADGARTAHSLTSSMAYITQSVSATMPATPGHDTEGMLVSASSGCTCGGTPRAQR